MGRAGKERGARGCGTVKTVPYCLAGERGRRERTGGGVVGKWRRERKRGERVRNGQDRSLLFGGGGEREGKQGGEERDRGMGRGGRREGGRRKILRCSE